MRFGSTVFWGLFCACSWTWCIGMYLPLILIQRFGWPGFIAFAVPNVLGCAAFGYAVKNRTRSEAMIAQHNAAMTWFSVVTIAYHVFFIAWLLSIVVPVFQSNVAFSLGAAVIVWCLGCVFNFLPNRDWLVLSVLTYAISIAALAAVGFDATRVIEWKGRDPLPQLMWLTPTIVFGFVLSPYLDLTFHRAIQNSPSKHAFAIFGAAFFVMIWLTCMMWFKPGIAERGLLTIGLAHLLGQSVFTIGAHLREVRSSAAMGDSFRRWIAMIGPLIAGLFVWIAVLWVGDSIPGESVYLRFLVFYGLVFPAYALWFVLSNQKSTRRGLVSFGLVILFCLPVYELGFIDGRTWMLPIPLGIVMVIATIQFRKLNPKAPTGLGT